MVERQTSMDEFLNNYSEQVEEDKEVTTSGEYEERTTLKAEGDLIEGNIEQLVSVALALQKVVV